MTTAAQPSVSGTEGLSSSIHPKEPTIVFPERIGEIYQLAHGAVQRWYWAPRMERDEVLLIKSWDSLDDGRARYTPHGAFLLSDQSPDAPARASIETRTYLDFDH